MESYRDLIVWQKSIQLVRAIYTLTESFPKAELHGLTSQLQKAAISIPSNIAEGSKRSSRKDFRKFLFNAFGSGAEVETQIEIAKILPFGKSLDYTEVNDILNEVMRMLNVMIRKLA